MGRLRMELINSIIVSVSNKLTVVESVVECVLISVYMTIYRYINSLIIVDIVMNEHMSVWYLLVYTVLLCSLSVFLCVDGQFMQIYNEKLFDLLLDKSRSNPLQIRETSDGMSELSGSVGGGTTVHVKGLTQHKVKDQDDVFHMLKKGIRNRAIRSTDYNHESSRSHSIFQLIVVIEEPDELGMMYTRRSTMSLVDLAGSEKWITNANAAANASLINNGPSGASGSNGSGLTGPGSNSNGVPDSGLNTPSGSMHLPAGGFTSLFGQQSNSSLNNTGGGSGMSIDNNGANNGELTDAQKELTHINTSLHILGLCVSALIEPGRKHIPYRDSALTR